MTMAKYDWEAIEREYRMGHKTLVGKYGAGSKLNKGVTV
jgi:hypothetical protein